ncbi:MAG: 2-oxo acid dehydrogenase subunit E2, partial [Thermomicrobiales bacterium]
MAIEIKVPPLGESLVDAVVGQWLKGEGDEISRGETILELETDKVNLEVTAEDDGILSSIAHQEGDTVTVGEVLGLLEAGASGGASANGSAPAEAPAAESAQVDATPAQAPDAAPSAPPTAAEAPPAAPAAAPASLTAEDAGGRAAPAVRRMAEEHGIDLAQVRGSGPGGRITRDDLFGHIASRGPAATAAPASAPAAAPSPVASAPAAPAAPGPRAAEEERVRLSRRRQTIAARLVEAQHTAAMLTTFNEVDMSAIMELRAQRKESFKERHGVGLGFMSFFTKASVGALKAFPYINAEIQGDEIVLKQHYDIG